MHENDAFLFLGILPQFKDVIDSAHSLTEKDWLSYRSRKNLGGVAGGHTDTIPLLYDTKDSLSAQHKQPMLPIFFQPIENIRRMYSLEIANASVARALITRMQPNSEIKSHKDKGEVSRKTHRVHLVVTTNSQCLFTVAEETRHLAPGELWLIDNTDKYHSVSNSGNTERIHLIVDLLHV